MLYIKKTNPPAEFIRKVSEIKSTPEWKNAKKTGDIRSMFDQLPKASLRESLLKEQHYLCAYCMRRISNDEKRTTIEHWKSLSEHKEQALDYQNMLAVCDGGRSFSGEIRKILSCDAAKEEHNMDITPLNRVQMDKISYKSNGFIETEPKDPQMEHDIQDILLLNGIWKNGEFLYDTSTELVKGRKNAYEILQRILKRMDKEGKCTSVRLIKLIQKIENEEERMEFAGVLLYFLKKKYKVLVKRGL